MTAIVLQGDARQLPLPDGCVDLIVTSPPYFSLRSYTDGGEHYAGQIGGEATPQEWLAALWECTAEWVRCLKPEGSLFVNLGDKYDSGTTTARINPGTVKDGQGQGWHQATPRVSLGNPKSLLGLPWRYATGCTDRLGLILRAEIIWAKPNGLPESVTDRVRRSHEQVFHFTRSPRYYAAVDEIREPSQIVFNAPQNGTAHHARAMAAAEGHHRYDTRTNNPLGKLPASVWYQHELDDESTGPVWTIPSAPLTVPPHLGVDHFAAFPPALVRPLVLGWSPPGVCTGCGQGRRPVRGVDWSQVPHTMTQKRVKTRNELISWGRRLRAWRTGESISRRQIADTIRDDFASDESALAQLSNWENAYNWPEVATWQRIEQQFNPPSELTIAVRETQLVPIADRDMRHAELAGRNRATGGGLGTAVMSITGYACACPSPDAPTRPSLVLDPFAGTGTTMLVASAYGRVGVGVDRSMDYARLARWRCSDPGERARARDLPKPPPVPEGMETLF